MIRTISNQNQIKENNKSNLVCGVLTGNEVNSIFHDDTVYDQIDLYFEEYLKELKESGMTEEEIEIESDNYMGDGTTYLIGDWKRTDDDKFEINKEGKLGFAGTYDSNTNHIVIEWSRYSIKCAPTSPCFVMRDGRPCGDINSCGDIEAYCIPEYFTRA